jgi:hypothetical protein
MQESIWEKHQVAIIVVVVLVGLMAYCMVAEEIRTHAVPASEPTITATFSKFVETQHAEKFLTVIATFRLPTQTSCANGCTSHVSGCNIKGNISFDTKEKIYQMPGQTYYEETVIDPSYGERWFCTEQEAITNGWRKSKQ